MSLALSGIFVFGGSALTPQFDVRTLSYLTAADVVVSPSVCSWTPQITALTLLAQMSIRVEFTNATDPGVASEDASSRSVFVTFAARTASVDSRSELWLQLPSTEEGIDAVWLRWPANAFARVSVSFPSMWPPCLVELASVSVVMQSRWREQTGPAVTTAITLLPSNSPIEIESFSLGNLTLAPLFAHRQHHYDASILMRCLPSKCNVACVTTIDAQLQIPEGAFVQWSFNDSALQAVAPSRLVRLPLRLFPSSGSVAEDLFPLIVVVADQQDPRLHSTYRTNIRVRYGP